MATLILPDDRRLLIAEINNLQSKLDADGHEPSESRRLQQELALLRSLKVATVTSSFTVPNCRKVQPGTTTILRSGHKRKRYSIGGVRTFTEGRLPSTSSIARALLGKSIGEYVQFGEDTYEVISIMPLSCY